MKDDNKHPIPLDYSCAAEEQRREQAEEDGRRRGIEDYNESTFGERKSLAFVWRLLAFIAVEVVLILMLRRWASRWVAFIGSIIYFSIEWIWRR